MEADLVRFKKSQVQSENFDNAMKKYLVELKEDPWLDREELNAFFISFFNS